MKKIVIGSDHGGYKLKEVIKGHLEKQGYECKDVGCYSLESCDYPQYGKAVAESVASGEVPFGILVCTTGIGISIVANKVKGIRAALCGDLTSARLTREHNDANILALGAGIVGENVALDIVDMFLNTPFSELEKHQRRINAIED
ncbi:MAG: ribose 5-phosphate isomerase B [Clostridia bacterium]|nr:ribose 5-phosphate isomerase B [Clostridia bacterium]